MAVRDDLDRKILDLLQNEFPLTVQPYLDLAQRVGINESEVLERIRAMKACGLIRRIGGIWDSRRLGFYSTLCAVSVPEDRIPEAAQIINNLPGVTHNYLRDHEYNMWFTLTSPSIEDSQATLRQLEQNLDLTIFSMPTEKVYKIKVSFDVGESS